MTKTDFIRLVEIFFQGINLIAKGLRVFLTELKAGEKP